MHWLFWILALGFPGCGQKNPFTEPLVRKVPVEYVILDPAVNDLKHELILEPDVLGATSYAATLRYTVRPQVGAIFVNPDVWLLRDGLPLERLTPWSTVLEKGHVYEFEIGMPRTLQLRPIPYADRKAHSRIQGVIRVRLTEAPQ